MVVNNRIAGFSDDLRAWRRHLHANPELGMDCHETADFVCARLREFGISEIHAGIARSGVVAVIHGQEPGPTIGLRADMDALPIREVEGRSHRSKIDGRMHACGHDGHTTMLLGAARYLNETRNFAGRVALIFQPGEETGEGASAMCSAGIMDQFEIKEVYALHTTALLSAGKLATCVGPIMAAVDDFEIMIKGTGGHAAYPHLTHDPVVAAIQIGQALQTIRSRNASGFDDLVLSVTQISSGNSYNVVPDDALMAGTIRSFDEGVREMVRSRMVQICDGVGRAMNVEASLTFLSELSATVNHRDQAKFAAEVAEELVGSANVDFNLQPRPGAEDFGQMLNHRPGAFIFIGQGSGPFAHDPAFDFNDDIAPIGATYFSRLVERALPRS
jgi:hippurate hydrolase